VLAHISPSPIVELNRAVAVGMAVGPAKGLEAVDALTSAPALKDYPQLRPCAATSSPSSVVSTKHSGSSNAP
jgi:predicted RNA polymerase sigma factor